MAVEQPCDAAAADAILAQRLAWPPSTVTVQAAEEGQFFFPGFIGTAPLSPSSPVLD